MDAPAIAQIVTLIRDEFRAFREDLTGPEFVDKHSSGLGPSVFLAAARAGEFDTFRVGKRFVARASDVRAYIERQLVQRERARPSEPKVDEFDVQLTPRVKRLGPNRVARSRSSSER
jgi:hypothetical protein